MRANWWRVLAALVAAVAMVAWPSGAGAQEVEASFEFSAEGMADWLPRLSSREIESYARMLGLDADQKAALQGLHEGYTTAMEAERAKVAEAMKAFQEKMRAAAEGDGGADFDPGAMGKSMQESEERVEALETGFFEDLRSLLTEEQAARFPKVERARRRSQGLRFSLVSGQGVDLVEVLDGLGVDTESSPDLAAQVERYETDMDRHLVAMEKLGEEMQGDAEEAAEFDMANMEEQMTKVEKMMSSITELAKGMRDTNRQHARLIGPMLGERAAAFDAEVLKRSFPAVYREGNTARALAAAEGMADLDASQRETLAMIRSSYAREREAADAKWAAAIEQADEESGGSMMAMVAAAMSGGEVKDPVSEARAARRDLDKRIKDKLLTVLTEEQRARLPEDEPEPKQDDYFGFGASVGFDEPD